MNLPKLTPIDQLLPYARNSRTHSPGQIAELAASIEEFGLVGAIVVRDGVIAKGHGTLAAVRQLAASGRQVYPAPGRAAGAEPLPVGVIPVVDVSGWSDAQFRAFVIADNRLALSAGWDEDMLRLELTDLKEGGFDLDLLGFDNEEIDALFSADEEPGGRPGADPDACPEVQQAHVSKPGDVWVLDRHRVMCGSATDAEQIATLMGGVQADLVWTDPPYNVAIEGKAGKILNDDMADAEFHQFLVKVYAGYFGVMRPGACIYVAHADSERANFTRAFVDAGLKLSQVLIWVKQSATLSRQDFNWQHEPILYGWKEGAGHYFCGDFTRTTVIDDDVDAESLKREELLALVAELRAQAMTTVVRHDGPTKSDLHPTMKPVDLVCRMIEWSSVPGEVVADFFGGSGSTLIAAQQTGRIARLMELDPKFVDVIVRRWQEYTGRQAIHEGLGVPFDSVAAESHERNA